MKLIFCLLLIAVLLTGCKILTGEQWAKKLGINLPDRMAFDSPIEPTPTVVPTPTIEPTGEPQRPPECPAEGLCFCPSCLAKCLKEFSPSKCSIFGN